MRTQSHQISTLVQDRNLKIEPPIPDLLRADPHEQELHALNGQRFLNVQIQQDCGIPEPGPLVLQVLRQWFLAISVFQRNRFAQCFLPTQSSGDISGAISVLNDLWKQIGYEAKTLLCKPLIFARETYPFVYDGFLCWGFPKEIRIDMLPHLAESREGPVLLEGPVRIPIFAQCGY